MLDCKKLKKYTSSEKPLMHSSCALSSSISRNESITGTTKSPELWHVTFAAAGRPSATGDGVTFAAAGKQSDGVQLVDVLPDVCSKDTYLVCFGCIFA